MANVEAGMRPLLVDAKQAARLLGIGRTMLYELIKTGALTPVHIGRCVRFSVSELERFVANGCVAEPATLQAPKPDPMSTKHRPARRATSRGVTLRLFDPAR